MDDQENYIHNGITYTPAYYGYFEFEEVNGSLVRAERHIRGCICALKGNCIRYCCDPYKTDQCPNQLEGYVSDVGGEVTYVEDLSRLFSVVYGPLNCLKYSITHDDEADNYTIAMVLY